jgi:hypothetical protein
MLLQKNHRLSSAVVVRLVVAFCGADKGDGREIEMIGN